MRILEVSFGIASPVNLKTHDKKLFKCKLKLYLVSEMVAS